MRDRQAAIVLVLSVTVALIGAISTISAGQQPARGEFAWRKEAVRARFITKVGGTEESEKAVALGLAWLAKQQKADGGWEFDAGQKEERVAATGLAVLTFLGAGETHTDDGKYKKTVEAGVAWLVKATPAQGAEAGKLSRGMYTQAIGTLALVEAYAMTKDKSLAAPAQAAVNYIVKAQAANGSWGYQLGSPGDTSIVGWQVQALRVAQLTRLLVPAATQKKTVEFLDLVSSGEHKAAYGYTDNKGAPGSALTAVGLLCRHHFDAWGPKNEGMAEGVAGLIKRRGTDAVKNSYLLYYATQVLRNFGGEEWTAWNEGPKGPDGVRKGGVRDTLVGLQIKKDGANQGSFDPDEGQIGKSCGRLGTTCMYLMTLEVYYRYTVK